MAAINWKLWIGAALVLACLFLVWRIMALSGCQTARQRDREQRREDRSKREVTCTVKGVIDGSRLQVVWGRRDRGEREIVLLGIEIPPAVDAAAKTNLERLTAGGLVRVEYVSHRPFSASDSEEVVEAAEMEATEPIIGQAFGDGGVNLAIEQLRLGLARCGKDAPEQFLKVEKEAKANHKGTWQ
jgi:endonuclease YncB( thermonuclease family)